MTGFALQVALQWAAVFGYIVATTLFAWALMFDRPALRKWAVAACAIGLVPHSVALIQRWIQAGHGPYMMKYEVFSSNAWIAIVLLLVFLWRRPSWIAVPIVVLPIAFTAMAIGLFSNPEIRQLPPTLRSIWLVFHVLFNKLAAGAFLLSLGTAIVLLWKLRGGTGRTLDRLPPPEALDAFTVRLVGFGFIFWTVTIAAGSIWANESWGRYWGWDPIETWSLVTWLGYGTFLHLHLLFRWRGAKTAWAAIACFVLAILTIFILPFLLPSIHTAYFQ